MWGLTGRGVRVDAAVSVVIPVYNEGEGVVRHLERILARGAAAAES